MDKEKILREIKRVAARNGGKAPGIRLFYGETGIKKSDWFPENWLRWSEALSEAGFSPNEFGEKFPDDVVFEKYAVLVRELGHIPVDGELIRKAKVDKTFPSPSVFNRFGGKNGLLRSVANFFFDISEFADIVALCEESLSNSSKKDTAAVSLPTKISVGYVYLMKSGKHYKIGRTNSVGRREWELGIKIPIPPRTIHSIVTDDPAGVEAYWHKRFADKRGEGEWFDLSYDDIAAFKRWTRII